MKARFFLTCGLTLVVAAMTSLAPVHAAGRFQLGDVTATHGEPVELPLTLTTSEPIDGLLAVFEWDPALATGVELRPAPSLADAAFVEKVERENWMAVGAIMSFDSSSALPAGEDILLAHAVLLCREPSAPQAVSVKFVDEKHSTKPEAPPLTNHITIGVRSLGRAEGLDLIAGSVQCGVQQTLQPDLSCRGAEVGAEFTRYYLTVRNRSDFPDELFVPAPELPPCGANRRSSRTWVSIYDQNERYVYGFCALSSAEDLDGIWFAVPTGRQPPEAVYVTLSDRATGAIYRSNSVRLSEAPCAPTPPPPGCPEALPVPRLEAAGTERYVVNGIRFTRYRLAVQNHSEFPESLFAPAPHLPPCGANARSSRTWVSILDEKGRRLYGFCALGSSSNLTRLWFAVRDGETPPAGVAVALEDRECRTRVVSEVLSLVDDPCEIDPRTGRCRSEFRFLRGDANNDGGVNVADGIYVLDFLFGGGPPMACRPVGDVDDNDTLNVADAVVLFNFLFSGGPPPVAPFPDCGVDSEAVACTENACNV